MQDFGLLVDLVPSLDHSDTLSNDAIFMNCISLPWILSCPHVDPIIQLMKKMLAFQSTRCDRHMNIAFRVMLRCIVAKLNLSNTPNFQSIDLEFSHLNRLIRFVEYLIAESVTAVTDPIIKTLINV